MTLGGLAAPTVTGRIGGCPAGALDEYIAWDLLGPDGRYAFDLTHDAGDQAGMTDELPACSAPR